ncbi:hypothetical protein QBC44DRAFT_305081 [Cladorrhinum sp. PSN332]|nr:hypothetical protein QBC44DRAFT_305081 [Cladorrhinum sp. PSN332]
MADENKPLGILGWFPWGTQDLPGWRFDVITLLAIIGESAIQEHVQTITASTLCLLPRIIPAPQALLRPQRPPRLPEVDAKMVGVYSGVVLDTVGFFANIIHPLHEMKPFEFKVLEIKHKELEGQVSFGGRKKAPWWKFWARKTSKATIMTSSSIEDDAQTSVERVSPEEDQAASTNNHTHKRKPSFQVDLERGASCSKEDHPVGPPKRAPTTVEKITDIITNPTMVKSDERYSVPPAVYSPTHVLSVFSCLLTVCIIAAARYWEDGTAILAIALISFASSIVCYASWWQPMLMQRRKGNKVPKGDVVIRTREGAFIVIRCTEEVARELYSGTVECQYVSHKFHRAYMGLGMVLLMVSIVLLGNCGWNSQAFIGGSYILLNGLYWVMGLLPPKYFWDLSRYEVQTKTPTDAEKAHEEDPSFTRTMWFAVRETRHGAWVERSGAMPRTDEWKQWLNEAVMKSCEPGGHGWDAVARKDKIMEDALKQRSPAAASSALDTIDEAAQQAPLDQVQSIRRRDTGLQGTGHMGPVWAPDCLFSIMSRSQRKARKWHRVAFGDGVSCPFPHPDCVQDRSKSAVELEMAGEGRLPSEAGLWGVGGAVPWRFSRLSIITDVQSINHKPLGIGAIFEGTRTFS